MIKVQKTFDRTPVKMLLAILLLEGVIQAKVMPVVPRESGLSNSSVISAASAAIPVGVVNVEEYLATCTRDANINACATRAANHAKAAGVALYFPAGIYLLSVWSPPCPLQIVGDGEGETVLQRPAGILANSVISSSNCGGLQIRNLTIDGNKRSNSTTGYAVILNGNWNSTLDGVEIRNSKGSGSALTVQSTADDSEETQSRFSRLFLHDNEGNGISVQYHAWNWVLRDSVIRNNGGVGISVIDYVFPPVAVQFSNCAIVNNDISYNTGSGVSLTSGISGGTPSRPTNGPFKTVENCKILGNQANHNSYYGIIMAGGFNIEIASNTTTYNGAGTGSIVAGINSALCDECDVHDNTVQYNAFYGIDTGGAINSKVHNNIITRNGNSIINGGNGINCGACQSVDITDNLVDSNGWTGGGSQIHLTTYDGGVSGFAVSAQNVSMRRNHLICANSNEIGLLVLSDPPSTTIEDNWTEGCTALKAYVLRVTSAQVHRNRQDKGPNGISLPPSSTIAVYPDAVEDVSITSSSGHTITALWPNFYSTSHQTVYAVVVTRGGLAYSTSPGVSFSGGGCETEPTGKVLQDNSGHVVGVNLTTYGAGCTTAPTMTFTDSTGSGAAATAYVLNSLPINGRELIVLWTTGFTVTHDPNNLDLLGGVGFIVPDNVSFVSTFRGCDNHWVEITRRMTSGATDDGTFEAQNISTLPAVVGMTRTFRTSSRCRR